MKNKKTELIFILDRSGSMGGLERETIKGYNSVVEKQAKLDGDLEITTILFDNQYEKIFDGAKPENAKLSAKEYYVRGSTALLDAIGLTLNQVSTRHENNPQEKPDKVIVAITTDGYENASKEYTYPKIKQLIENKKSLGWEFLFLAANIDEKRVGANLGIDTENCTKFSANDEGIKNMSAKMSKMMSSLRK